MVVSGLVRVKGMFTLMIKNLEAASCYKMPYNYIYAASCDGDGKLWLGTRTMGLCIDGRWYHKNGR